MFAGQTNLRSLTRPDFTKGYFRLGIHFNLPQQDLSAHEIKAKSLKKHGKIWVHITKWKMQIKKSLQLYDSNCMISWKNLNYRVNKNEPRMPEVVAREEKWIGRAQRICITVKLFHMVLQHAYMSLYMCINHKIFPKCEP